MRHQYKGRKLGTSPAHTKAMKRSLTAALLYNDRIKTIESRAKEIRPEVDRIITWAKKGDLHSRRLAIARLGGDKELVREVFEKVNQGMFSDREGGYTRIMKLGPRKGDGAPMVIIELCNEPVKKKAKPAAAKPKKAAAKKVEEPKDEAVEATEEVIEETTDEAVVEEATAETEAPEATEDAKEVVEEKVEEVLEEKEEAEDAPADKAEETEEAKEAEEVKEEQFEAEAAEAKDNEVHEEEKEVESEKDIEE